LITTVGIDFGASRLRVATACEREPRIVRHAFVDQRMPVVDCPKVAGNRSSGLRGRMTSLKRVLDFDQMLRVPPSGINSLDYLAERFRTMRHDCQGPEPNGTLHCIVAVPPCFSQRQRSALQTVAKRAGFPRVKLADDTLAVLLAAKESLSRYRNVLVYSWGASTFSTYLYEVRGGGFRPIAQEGDRNLGGDDIDATIADALLAKLAEMIPGPVPRQLAEEIPFQVFLEAEAAKQVLARGNAAQVLLNRLLGSYTPPAAREWTIDVPADLYRQILRPMLAETLELVEKVLSTGNAATPDVIMLSGGMAATAAVQEALQERFSLPFLKADENAVALGAAAYGLALPQAEWEKAGPTELKAEPAEAPSAAQTECPAEPKPLNERPAEHKPRIERWSETFAGRFDTAEQLYRQGRLLDAIAAFEELLSELDKFGGNLYREAASRCQAAGDAKQALMLLKRAWVNDPHNRLVAANLAQLCYSQGAHARDKKNSQVTVELADEGIGALRSLGDRAAEYHVLLAQLLHLKGCGLWDLGRLPEAEEAIAESARLDPKHAVYRDDLDRVRGAKTTRGAAHDVVLSPGSQVGRNDPCPCGSGKKFK